MVGWIIWEETIIENELTLPLTGARDPGLGVFVTAMELVGWRSNTSPHALNH